MNVRSRSGQVTVLLSVILLAVIALGGVLVDISRISSGETIARSAVESAARSALADYSSRLKEDYGIFALTKSQEDVGNKVKDYLEKNLAAPDTQSYPRVLDLYGFRVDSISVTPIFNLTENKAFRQQVLEYMKYRAPKEILEGFADKLQAVKDAGKMSEAYDKKVKVDKILGNMDKFQQGLKKAIDGIGAQGKKFVNGFNANGSWSGAFNRYNQLFTDIAALRQKLNEIDSSLARLQEEGQADKGKANDEEANEEKARERRESMEVLQTEKASVEESIATAGEEQAGIFEQLRNSLTGDFIKPVEDAINDINSIVETGRKAEAAIAQLEGFLGGFAEGSSFLKEFMDTAQAETAKLKELILSGKKAAGLLDKLNSDAALLKDIKARLDASGGTALPADLPDMLGRYATIDYTYEKPEKGDKKADPREGKAEEAKEALLDAILEDADFTASGIKPEDLPSHKKVPSKDFTLEDALYAVSDSENGNAGPAAGDKAVYCGELASLGDNVNLYDEEGSFEENALGFIGDIGKAVSGDLVKLRDNLYLDEYAMGTFKNAVPALKTGSGAIRDTDLGGVDKAERKTLFQGEVEYILHGKPSQKTNILMTKGQILLMRFGLDTLHVYTDARKREMATGIAAAVAGWWTGGAGIPVISNLIMCGWGMGEAVIDMKDIMDGKSVPIYKSAGDWKLDIGAGNGGAKTNPRFCFSYYDYLRLFLLVMDENKKLDRMEDLVQIDMQGAKSGFSMGKSNTYVRVEAEISMKYLFLSQPFMPAERKAAGGRYKYRVLIYEGY